MFWKKKSDEIITIELDSDDRRNGVRIQPVDRIQVHYQSQAYQLLDISFMGLSFSVPDADSLKESEQLEINLTLPLRSQTAGMQKDSPFSCHINVIRCSQHICHCQFWALNQQQQLLLDRFILNEQKRQILAHSKAPASQAS